MSEADTRDRFRGCLLGLAAGDALGTTLEFTRPGSFEPIDDMVGNGSLMRLAPVPMYFAGDAAEITSLADNLHGRVVSACGVDSTADERAWRWLERHDERQYFYVDATSFEIMRRERITEALASDGDFSAADSSKYDPDR